MVPSAIFETEILSFCCSDKSGTVGQNWQTKNQHGAERFWHSYLVYRHKKQTSSVGGFAKIRQIAPVIHEAMKEQANLEDITDSLYWLALEHATEDRHGWTNSSRDPNPRLNLLSAAVYFNLIPLAKKLLDQEVDDIHVDIFPAPLMIAAWTGHREMLKLLYNSAGMKQTDLAIIGASIRGDLEMFKLAMNPTETSDGEVLPPENILTWAKDSTNNPELYRFIRTFLPPLREDGPAMDLLMHCLQGNMPMVQYLLDCGAGLNGITCTQGIHTALVSACMGSHEDIVDLLLEHGADVNYEAHVPLRLTPLPMAAWSGSLTRVRKLLDRGAHVNEMIDAVEIRWPAIFWAVAIEHTPMFELLMERGASLDGKVGEYSLKMAQDQGLDSMVDLLREYGVVKPAERRPPGGFF